MRLLDSSFLIDFFRDEKYASFIPENEIPVVSVISYYEIMSGAKRLRSKKEEEFFQRLFAEIEILDFSLPAAHYASAISARMKAAGTPVNALDILIAGTACASNVDQIITADKDFEIIARFSDLQVIRYSDI